MASKFDEQFKAKVIADRVLLGSDRAAARKHGISATTVKRWCVANGDLVQKCAVKKSEVEADVLDYIKSLSPKLCRVLDLVVEGMTDESKLEQAKLSELATVYGILADKGLAVRKLHDADADTLAEARRLLGGLKSAF